MDILIIVFVIYMIYSVVANARKTAGAGQKMSRPARQGPPSPEQLFPDLFFPPVPGEEREDINEVILSGRLAEQTPEPAPAPAGYPAIMPRIGVKPTPPRGRLKDKAGLKPGLEQLLQGRTLPWTILATEVFAAPRGRRPLSRRQT